MNQLPVRTRFAPSPTGEPHVGNIRTAIFAWLFARKHKGSFIIRIEDTDQARVVHGAVDSILESLAWLGINWDEGPNIGGQYGPYFQSERQRQGLYSSAVDQLIGSGDAYYCSCSLERLKDLRENQVKAGRPPGYDKLCRTKSKDKILRELQGVRKPVVRFAMPQSGATRVSDKIRGDIEFQNVLIDDFVILKSDGFPTYHLANVVDDHAMHISHVIRAEEWLPSLPRHINLYTTLGCPPPVFAHVPIILAPDRSKLSKRHGATSIMEFRQNGYMPAAMLNFLCLLGWSLDDKTELFTMEELIESFSIERVSKSSAIFDSQKLEWMNGQYIRGSSQSNLVASLKTHWSNSPIDTFETNPDEFTLDAVIPLIQDRIKNLNEAAPMINFLFTKKVTYSPDMLIQKKMDKATTQNALKQTLKAMDSVSQFQAKTIEDVLRTLAQRLYLKPGQLFGTLRIATTGQKVSPPLFETLEIIGKDKTMNAIRNAIDILDSSGESN